MDLTDSFQIRFEAAERGSEEDHGQSPEALRFEVEELFAAHAQPLERYAALLLPNREIAREAVQETFLRYFASRRGGVVVKSHRAFLFRILRNYATDLSRHTQSHPETAHEDVSRVADPSQNPERGPARADLLLRLRRRLSPREMEVVLLRAEGLNYEEVAALLGISPGTVGSLLARASRKLKKALEFV
jgi:RNA polymerase sigma-70 factor (ECF subfamily)